MSLTGKGTLSLRKSEVLQQKKAGTAYRRLVFAHKASAGETGITIGSLVQPSEMAALGFVNPSSSDILAANILFYKKNLTVISSARGVLMQDLSYTVPTSARIEFQGFTALQDEIFTCLLETGVRDGVTVVDASPIVATGELSIGSTDFNVGTPFEVNKYNSQQIGAVLVFRNGQIQFRNPSNGTSGGNYQEVNNGDGLSTVIRFNNAPVGQTDNIVVWGHLLAERPNGSMMAAIESLAGQLDSMIPTLAALAGVPESTFQAAPNNQDLKAFGDKVEALLDAQVPIITEWVSYTPTGSWTGPTTYSGKWRRVGDTGEYDILVSLSGAPNPVALTVNLPSGHAIDTTKYTLATSLFGMHGTASDSGGLYEVAGFAEAPSKIYVTRKTSVADNLALVDASNPFTFGSGDYVQLKFSVPISGWSSTQTLRQQLGL